MPDLLILDLDDDLRRSLEARARAHQRSLADEARETLRVAIAAPAAPPAAVDIVGLFTKHFGPENGVSLELPSRAADPDRPQPDFSGPEYDR